MGLTWEGWATVAVIFFLFLTLVRNWAPPDMTMLAAAFVLGALGILNVGEAFSGFINPGVITIAALFVVAAAMRETGAMDTLGRRLLGRAHTERSALVRMAGSVLPMSAFLNNTPVVAMLMPILSTWGRNHQVSPSRLLIPLSYLAILGGTCTLIGTSTTIVVDSLVKRAAEQAATPDLPVPPGLEPIGMFEVAWLGLPFALIGTIYLLSVGRRLLPERHDLLERLGSTARQYLVDMQVQPGCSLVGQSVEEAGLRHLPGLFLVEILREGKSITPVRPDEPLLSNDILTFTGVVSHIVDLERIPGLLPVADEGYEEHAAQRREKSLCEAVISATSPLIGQTVRGADFRAAYNAAIVAVHRGGQRLHGRVGDIVLQHGDTLLLQTGPHFIRAHRNNPDFYLVGGVEESRAVRNDKAIVSMCLLALLVVLLSVSQNVPFIEMPLVAGIVALLMIATQCISPAVARQAVDWSTIITIAGAIGVGKALEKTGVAAEAAEVLVGYTRELGPVAVLAIIYIGTSILTECVTTKGAAVLMFPIALATAGELGLGPRPFIFAVLFAAAASFVTPLGYQTNLMVLGPGGYRFTDFLRVGLPLSVMVTILAIILIPVIWPLN